LNKTAVSPAQLAKCILLTYCIHVQLQLPAVRAQTKTSYSLLNEMA